MTKCSRCDSEKVIFKREDSGEFFCRACFIESFEKRVRKTIAKYDLLREDDRIALALSGGKDSLALLKLLSRLEKNFPMASLVAITIDEGIPGYRDESLKLAIDLCNKLDVEHYICTFNELYNITIHEYMSSNKREKIGLGPCSLCGILRRRALDIMAEKVNATVIATAHTLDDIVQTYIMNILRGDLPKGLIGIRNDEVPIPRVAPFRLTPEREVVLYAYIQGIPFQETPCPYASFSQRDLIRRFLTEFEETHPGSLYAALSRIEELLSGQERKYGKKLCKSCLTPSSNDLCRACQVMNELLGLKTTSTL
ncbi:MAG: TIGR00269 family protein [Halobacteria archaeon]